jgi:hypothetical protein
MRTAPVFAVEVSKEPIAAVQRDALIHLATLIGSFL